MSWIALDDAVRAILHALRTDALSGPANVVAPEPVTNRAFTATLGRVLGRPAPFVMPASAVGLLFGSSQFGFLMFVASLVNVLIATVAGTVIPLTFRALGRDPALASNIFLTLLSDLVGFGGFLAVATLLLA